MEFIDINKNHIYTDLYIMIECQPIKVDGATLKKKKNIYIYNSFLLFLDLNCWNKSI